MAACIRTAWLVLGNLNVPLESLSGGWFCQNLDLGSPDIREVINPRPDADGMIDRTQYLGARVISAEVKAEAGAGARIDAVAAQFAPFMVPSARPVLHYVLDRPGALELTLNLRAVSYDWPIQGGVERDINMQWKAADPVARNPVTEQATAYAGVPTGGGRQYPLTYNRIYPAGGGASSTGIIISNGQVPIRPLVTIWGPVTGPAVAFQPNDSTPPSTVTFVNSFRIDVNNYVVIDTLAKTAYMNGPGGTSVLAFLDWFNTTWPILPVAPAQTVVSMTGTSTSAATQAVISWQDGYLI
jgi:hypothetical protein